MMFRDMERDVFGDSGDLCPMLQGIVYCTLVRQRKDYIAVFRFAAFRQPFQRLLRLWQGKRLFGLLHRDFDTDTPAAPL